MKEYFSLIPINNFFLFMKHTHTHTETDRQTDIHADRQTDR